ncbi:hypothetical protein ACLOJK_030363 [Asimina triloba]
MDESGDDWKVILVDVVDLTEMASFDHPTRPEYQSSHPAAFLTRGGVSQAKLASTSRLLAASGFHTEHDVPANKQRSKPQKKT